jgi:hypothetical protein
MNYTKFIFDGSEKPSYWYRIDEKDKKSVQLKNLSTGTCIESMDYLLDYMSVGEKTFGKVVKSTKKEFEEAFHMVVTRLKTELNIK